MGATSSISFYAKINFINSKETIPLDLFFSGIQDGTWEDISIPIRLEKDKVKRRALKEATAPSVTLSGKFGKREDELIEQHSGCIGIDIDDCDVNLVKEVLIRDPYCCACFVTIGGDGVCGVFKINSTRHRDAFKGISEYLYNTYKIVCDPTSINVSRPRYVSFDPDLYEDWSKPKFLQYPKDKPPKRIDKVLYAEEDFKVLMEEVQRRRLNMCEGYHDWIRIGFAICHKFGEGGRDYFHILSQFSSKYDGNACDKQYTAIVKHKGEKAITISTLYWYAKNAGLSVYSERTKIVAYSAAQGKKAGISEISVAENLKKEGITGVESLITQVYQDNIDLDEDTIIDQLELYLRQRYEMKRNLITRFIEIDGKQLEQVDMNSIYLKAKKVLEKINYELFDRLINSDFVPSYNPILDFFAENVDRKPKGCIDKFFGSIETKDTEYAKKFGKKWLVGSIASAYGFVNVLYLILSGKEMGTGKTEFYRRMLPQPLKKYYAQSKLDKGTDDEILMTKKWFIMDDEMSGKTKKENILIRNLTSVDVFTIRVPYGRYSEDLRRLANLCATTNEDNIIPGDVDNRRLIPIHVYSINFEQYNSVDKIDLLMEAYHLFHEGFDYEVRREEMAELNKDKISFEETNEEKELIIKYFEPGEEQFTSTDIKVYLENVTRQRLTINKIGRVMNHLKFKQIVVNTGFTTKRCWLVKRNLPSNNDEPPF